LAHKTRNTFRDAALSNPNYLSSALLTQSPALNSLLQAKFKSGLTQITSIYINSLHFTSIQFNSLHFNLLHYTTLHYKFKFKFKFKLKLPLPLLSKPALNPLLLSPFSSLLTPNLMPASAGLRPEARSLRAQPLRPESPADL
jgi:hypothetical protein